MLFKLDCPLFFPSSFPSCPSFHKYLLSTYYMTGAEAAKLNRTCFVSNLGEHTMSM